MPLKTSEKIALRKKTAQDLVNYIQGKKFSLDELSELAAEDAAFAVRLDEARQLLEQLPDPDEQHEFAALTAAVTNRVDEPETAAAVEAYLKRWQNRASAAEHVRKALMYGKRVDERKAFVPLKQRVKTEIDNYAATGRMPSAELSTAIGNFVHLWGNLASAEADIREAHGWLSSIQSVYSQIISQEWARLFDTDGRLRGIDELENFLRSLPVDERMRRQADEVAWQWVNGQPDMMAAAERYNAVFGQQGLHSGDVSRLRDYAGEWAMYANMDIYSIINFVETHPGHPFAAAAGRRIQELKEEALEAMRRNPTTVPVQDFRRMMDSPYFTRDELMQAAGLDENMYNSNILNYENLIASLPLAPSGESQYGAGLGEEGITDIVLFGINSSGKTCVLSGLLRHDKLWFDDHNYSGDYGRILNSYASNGIAVSGTPTNFVATIKAEVSRLDDRYIYKFNLFEMAGEAFRQGIAHGVDAYGRPLIKFDDMGTNAAQILKTGNDKVFFLLIDPTVSFTQLEQQKAALNAMVSLMFGDRNGSNPNEDVMKCVKGLHFIVTKSDTLPAGNLQQEALKRVRMILNSATCEKIIEGCREFGINASKNPELNGRPRVFPFSLGHFTIGNMFRYDPTGASTILRVICDYCSPERKGGIGMKIRSFFTTPFI